jgi:hypothetical protein
MHESRTGIDVLGRWAANRGLDQVRHADELREPHRWVHTIHYSPCMHRLVVMLWLTEAGNAQLFESVVAHHKDTVTFVERGSNYMDECSPQVAERVCRIG